MHSQPYLLASKWSHTHKHTLTFSHQGAINLDGADEKGSRRYGESVRVGVAVTVTGLGGLACLANTASDVERGTVFHHLEKCTAKNDAKHVCRRLNRAGKTCFGCRGVITGSGKQR